MRGNVSGWYARLDRECEDRIEQMNIWLDAWEEALRTHQPQASQLPSDWPTLPASLLTDPGHVLDHLLCRHDAESDGRSPRGAHPTPTRLADAIIADELKVDVSLNGSSPILTNVNLAALPPAFRAQAEAINVEDRAEDTRVLLSSMQLLDVCEVAATMTRRRLLLSAIRAGVVSLDNKAVEGRLKRREAEKILKDVVRVGDALRDDWPWDEPPRLLMGNPPWLRIKDRFRGHPDGSALRKELGEELRSLREEDGSLRFSTLRGNVNLYRLFLERSLQLVRAGGRVRLIVPDSLLREQSSAPLRRLLVDSHEWTGIWTFPESARLFTGVTQGVLILGITVDGRTEELICHGPAEANELCSRNGLDKDVPRFDLDRPRWARWSRMEWAVPRLPRDRYDRQNLLIIIDDLADLPRLAESHHWLAGKNRLRVRVGEVDQTTWSADIKPWKKGSRGTPFIRGIHFRNDEEKGIWLHHPSFDSSIGEEASERKQAQWRGPIQAPKHPRLACQAIVNAQQLRRLRWVVLPAGCVLGNSVNHLELPMEVANRIAKNRGDLNSALSWLCELLNDTRLDAWARAWAANNNVNNYELEMLPLPESEPALSARFA